MACSLAPSQVVEVLKDCWAQGTSHVALGQLHRTWLSLGLLGQGELILRGSFPSQSELCS